MNDFDYFVFGVDAPPASLTVSHDKKAEKSFGGISFRQYLCAPLKRPVRLRVRTPPFHGGDTSSNLVRATRKASFKDAFFIFTLSVIYYNQADERSRRLPTAVSDENETG